MRPLTKALLAALLLSAAPLVSALPLRAQQAPPPPANEKPEDFPDGPHREDTFYACTACHAFRIVSTQGMSRDRWDESLTWMTERHRMPKLEGKERQQVLDYLSTAFPERRQPGGWRNPFAPQ
ncbi:MAG: hypothetical protein RL291_942 [Pseudomonadota bacterium]